MVSGLVVKGTSKYCPEPAVSGIVLSCCHLHLSPSVNKRHIHHRWNMHSDARLAFQVCIVSHTVEGFALDE